MASNPMQKQKRISFILGMLLMLLISSIVVGLLVYRIFGLKNSIAALKGSKKEVQVLNSDIKSGQILTADMMDSMAVDVGAIPGNAVGNGGDVLDLGMQTMDGEDIYTKRDVDKLSSLYLEKNGRECQVKRNSIDNLYIEYLNGIEFDEDNGNESENQSKEYYIYTKQSSNGYANVYIAFEDREYQLRTADNRHSEVIIKYGDENKNKFFSVTKGNNNEAEVNEIQIDENSELSNYLVFMTDNSSPKIKYKPEKKYIELTTLPIVAKIDMRANTIITKEMVTKTDEASSKDARNIELNVINLPSTLKTGDFIDIRFRLSNGTDYIVVSKKEIEIPEIDGIPSADTIQMKMTEDEILTISNAIVEAYMVKGSELYATLYTEPGSQEKATPTYSVSVDVLKLIQNDPNIVEEARNALYRRYNTSEREVGGNIRNEIDKDLAEAEDKVEAGIKEKILKQKELREQYLKTLSSDE